MNTSSLRRRVMLATIALMAGVLVVVVASVTIAYQTTLRRDLRQRLEAAAKQIAETGSAQDSKRLAGVLALDGVATDVTPAPQPAADTKAGRAPGPVKPGTDATSSGGLLIVHATLTDGSQVTISASERSVGQAVNRLLIVEICVGVGALALAAVASRRATATALRPLGHVVDTARQIAAGDASRRLRPTRPETELGAMATAFDQMVDALEVAAEQARAAEAAMRQFLADASHELRTPVAAVAASAEHLLREQPERPERDAIEATLARDAARVGRLVADLLGLARLEANEPSRPERVDLIAVAQAAVEEASRQASGVTLRLDVETDPAGADGTGPAAAPGPAVVRGDPDGLSRVLRNLLDNAVAVTRPAGHVTVAVRAQGTDLLTTVVDDGPGVPDTEREHIFERFVRLSPASSGSGLGLAIARRVARQHGGDLTCDPAPSGGRFTLRLPAARP